MILAEPLYQKLKTLEDFLIVTTLVEIIVIVMIYSVNQISLESQYKQSAYWYTHLVSGLALQRSSHLNMAKLLSLSKFLFLLL